MTLHFDKGLFGQLRARAGATWSAYIHHDFIQQLAAGTLPHNAFKRFLTQDYLFLLHFSRAYALLAAKSQHYQDIRAALNGLQAIIDELPLHVDYCAQWGLSETDMAQQPEAAETIAYTRYVMDIGLQGDRLDLMVALMPCIAGYAEIGTFLVQSSKTVWQDNPYATWIRTYESVDYQQGVQAAMDLLESLGRSLAAEQRLENLSKIFNSATQLETDFWQMGLNYVAAH